MFDQKEILSQHFNSNLSLPSPTLCVSRALSLSRAERSRCLITDSSVEGTREVREVFIKLHKKWCYLFVLFLTSEGRPFERSSRSWLRKSVPYYPAFRGFSWAFHLIYLLFFAFCKMPMPNAQARKHSRMPGLHPSPPPPGILPVLSVELLSWRCFDALTQRPKKPWRRRRRRL